MVKMNRNIHDTSVQPRIVVIGGGQGTAMVLAGLRKFSADLVGIISTTDTGRSTGKIRRLAGIPAPGDIRNVIAALGNQDTEIVKLIQHRLRFPEFEPLDGVAFGNLIIAALTQMTGSFAEAVNILNRLVENSIKILPVSTNNVHLSAKLVDNTIISEEYNVRRLNKPAIESVFIDDAYATGNPEALLSISNADIIVLGPGSLFTTLLACLSFSGVKESIKDSDALVLYICNTTTQPGQTDSFSIYDHIFHVVNCLGKDVLNAAIINVKDQSPQALDAYKKDGVEYLKPSQNDIRKVKNLNVELILSNVAEKATEKRDLWQKQDTVRHDPDVLASEILSYWNLWRNRNG